MVLMAMVPSTRALGGQRGSPGHSGHSRAGSMRSVRTACAPAGVHQQLFRTSPGAEPSEGMGRRSTPWPEPSVSSASMNTRSHCNISPQETPWLTPELSGSQEFLLYPSPSETNRRWIFSGRLLVLLSVSCGCNFMNAFR